MRHGHRAIPLPVIVACAGLLLGLGCVPPRYYDPYYSDYHTWNQPEIGFYMQWETETRRPHQDFGRRPADEQKEYFTWRHNHGDQNNNQHQDNRNNNRDNRPNQ